MARDALFHFPLGSGIRMEYPDGDVQSYSFDAKEGYKLEGLARGIYRVTVTGAKGMAPITPIALSRDQDVELLVFSYLDMGVFLGIGLFLSLGLLLFGRPYIVTQVVAFGSRFLPKGRSIQPFARPQFFNTLLALRSRIFPKREEAGLEESRVEAFNIGQDDQQDTYLDEDVLPSELAGAMQDPPTKAEDVSVQKRTRRRHQKTRVRDLA